jgi:hypothetical protein
MLDEITTESELSGTFTLKPADSTSGIGVINQEELCGWRIYHSW